jgi:competence protein ComEA
MINKILKSLILIVLLVSTIATVTFTFENEGTLVFTKEIPQENTAIKSYSYISGAVLNPGVYEIFEHTRIIDVINAAGGYTDDADSNFISSEINLSKKLEDGEKIFIKFKSSSSPIVKEGPQNNLININTASLSELEELPGVGASTGEKIIQGRPYKTKSDLKNITSIGDKKYEQIENLITI